MLNDKLHIMNRHRFFQQIVLVVKTENAQSLMISYLFILQGMQYDKQIPLVHLQFLLS